MDIQGQSSVNKNHRKEIILLFTTILFILLISELSFRFYYWYTDQYIAVDENELCLKEMKLDNLPSSKQSGMNPNFVDFKRMGYWDDDPLIGVTLKKNYTDDEIHRVVLNGTPRSIVFYGEHHHNSQGMFGVRDFSLAKPKNVSLRIGFFGDSFACAGEAPLLFGMGAILEELIDQSEVLNFCVGGRGIETMYARYLIEAKPYQPDVIIFNIFIDDLRRPFGCEVMTPNLSINDGRLVIGPRKWPALKDFYEKYELPLFESYFVKHFLWVYNTRVQYAADMRRGFELFNVMMDNLKTDTGEKNVTLIVSVIQQAYPNEVTLKYYDDMINVLKDKNMTFLDTAKHFNDKRQEYRNQSFYYIEEGKPLGHFSVVGNALHAQALRNILVQNGLVQKMPDYFFANLDKKNPLYLIEEDRELIEKEAKIRKIVPFEIRDVNYKNTLLNEEKKIMAQHVLSQKKLS